VLNGFLTAGRFSNHMAINGEEQLEGFADSLVIVHEKDSLARGNCHCAHSGGLFEHIRCHEFPRGSAIGQSKVV
jgi:hypothetical protein